MIPSQGTSSSVHSSQVSTRTRLVAPGSSRMIGLTHREDRDVPARCRTDQLIDDFLDGGMGGVIGRKFLEVRYGFEGDHVDSPG